jgi:hypothetical protein
MKNELTHTALICLLIVALGATARAQSSSPTQFYANARGEHGWTFDAKKKLRTTTWFVKNPADNPEFQQMTCVIYDGKPNEVLYLHRATKRVVGRLDLKTEQFALLPPDKQTVRQALDKFTFPPPSPLPRIDELFQPLPNGSGAANRQKLPLPPPTIEFPQLQHSAWETNYLSADRFLIRSIVKLDGDQGTYQLTEKPGIGQLSDVRYEREGDEHVIRGHWSLGRSQGWFKLNVPAENLNVFWGEFGFQEGRTVGAWDGVRRSTIAARPQLNSGRN